MLIELGSGTRRHGFTSASSISIEELDQALNNAAVTGLCERGPVPSLIASVQLIRSIRVAVIEGNWKKVRELTVPQQLEQYSLPLVAQAEVEGFRNEAELRIQVSFSPFFPLPPFFIIILFLESIQNVLICEYPSLNLHLFE